MGAQAARPFSRELLDKFRTTTAERRDALTAMGDAQWNELTATPAGPDSYGRFMRVRIFDCWMHEHDIRDALRQPEVDAVFDGADARLALDEIAASMGFVVGKLGKAPDGSRVRLELTGPLQRTINVAVEGRGRVVDDFGGADPTATIRSTACCSPGWPAAGPPSTTTRFPTAATRPSVSGSSSTSIT